jgi:Homeodomain-like domain-containing protein
MRKPLEILPLTAEELETLDKLYRRTKDVRLCTRAQIILLAREQRMNASAIARMVREDDQTVCNWLKRWRDRRHQGTERSPDNRYSLQDHEKGGGAHGCSQASAS